jgi:2-aminoadipate transaminase
MLTGGSAQALDHLCTLYTRPGDTALVEAPTYHETLKLFRDHHLNLVQIPIDRDGLQPDALAVRLRELEQAGKQARFLYIIPSFQNPSGITLAAARRPAILELARQYGFFIIEDDVYRDLAYSESAPASFFGHDPGDHTVRIGSFSKILAPGVRLGWLLASARRIECMVESGLRQMGGGANTLMAHIVANYCRSGLLEEHLAVSRKLYAQRRDTMLAALAEHMPRNVRWTKPSGGFFVWLSLPSPLTAVSIVEASEKAGLLIPPGDAFFAEEPTGQHLRLSFSYVTPDKIQSGVATLGQIVRGAAQLG